MPQIGDIKKGSDKEVIMPFKSEAQRKKFYAMAKRGEVSMSKVKEWESETHGKLPKKVKKRGS